MRISRKHFINSYASSAAERDLAAEKDAGYTWFVFVFFNVVVRDFSSIRGISVAYEAPSPATETNTIVNNKKVNKNTYV